MTRKELESKLTSLIEQARSMVESAESVEAIEAIKQEIAQTKQSLDAIAELERTISAVQEWTTTQMQPISASWTQSSTQDYAQPQTLDDVARYIVQHRDFRSIIEQGRGRFVAQNVTIPTPTYTYTSVTSTPQPSASVVGTLVQVGTRANAVTLYARETTTSLKGSAAAVGKGASKPTTTQTYTSVQSVAQTIAHLLRLSEQDLGDIAGLQQVVQQRGLQQLLATEEDQVLNGDGNAPNITGLLSVAGTTSSSQGTDTLLDAIIKALAANASNGAVPSAIVCSYATWSDLQTVKDTTGGYLLPASITVGVTNVRGVPLIASAVCPDNKVIIGDNRYATLWRVGGIAIEVGRNADDFASNMVTMRIEERIALDVYAPRAYHILTLA